MIIKVTLETYDYGVRSWAERLTQRGQYTHALNVGDVHVTPVAPVHVRAGELRISVNAPVGHAWTITLAPATDEE